MFVGWFGQVWDCNFVILDGFESTFALKVRGLLRFVNKMGGGVYFFFFTPYFYCVCCETEMSFYYKSKANKKKNPPQLSASARVKRTNVDPYIYIYIYIYMGVFLFIEY